VFHENEFYIGAVEASGEFCSVVIEGQVLKYENFDFLLESNEKSE
jgi:hypothetical protein